MSLRWLVLAVALAVVGGFQARRLPLAGAPLCRGRRAGARLVLRASAGVQQQQQWQQQPPPPAASTFASKSRRLTARLAAWLVKSWNAGKLRVATALLVLGLVFGRVSSANAGFVTAAPAAGAAGSCRIVASAPAADSTTTATAAAARQTRLGKSLSKIKQAPSTFIKEETDQIWRWGARAEKGAEAVLKDTEVEVEKTFRSLFTSLQGAKLDTLLLLIVTSAVIPIFKYYNTSSILGFLLFGTVLGPNCLNWLKDVHMIDMLGELGIVFFLFEIGLELSLERLVSMKKDVFGLGTSQFVLTSAAGAAISRAFGLSTAAAVTIGGSMALSSSAFVLQLLKDKSAMGSRVGRASFGILLLHDLAVVPLLVIVELLAKGGSGLGKALGIAGVKTVVAVSSMSFAGRKLLDPLFFFVARSSSQEAFLSIILTTVLLMSFITQGIGLSNTLGAFLAGLLLAETKYRYQVESDIAPFRGLLLGFFFITVGFSIDPRLFFTSLPQIVSLLALVLFSKASIITALSLANGMTFSEAQQTGILNAQVGEFAFVAFAIAERSSLISPKLNKILLTTVALSMALTPFLDKAGASIASRLEAGNGEFLVFYWSFFPPQTPSLTFLHSCALSLALSRPLFSLSSSFSPPLNHTHPPHPTPPHSLPPPPHSPARRASHHAGPGPDGQGRHPGPQPGQLCARLRLRPGGQDGLRYAGQATHPLRGH